MLDEATRFGADKVDFLCLWNGEGGDGPGGAQHMMEEVRSKGRPHGVAGYDEAVELKRDAGLKGESMPKPICFMIMPYGRKAHSGRAQQQRVGRN